MIFREKLEKLTDNIIPDLRDNFPNLSKIKSWEVNDTEPASPSVDKMREKFLSRGQHQELVSLSKSVFESGKLYEYTWLVGQKSQKTLHPHTFLGEKSEKGANLFFLDPEHNVGNHNFFRPKISNLISMHLGENYEDSQINIIRFNIQGLAPEQLKLQRQFLAAKELLNQEKPTMIKDLPENILFQAVVKDHQALLSARYTNEQKAQDFLRGGHGSRALRGKIKANTIIINRLINFLRAGKFEETKRFKPS